MDSIVPPIRIRPRLPFMVVIVSFVVLLVAGLFLYRWVNRLSQMDRQHQQEDLDASMINLQRGFSATLREATWFFQPMPRFQADIASERYWLQLYSQWKSTAQWPQLVSAISIAFKSAHGGTVLRRLDPATERFEDEAWPSSMEAFRNALESVSNTRRVPRPVAFHGPDVLVLNGRPVLVLPMLLARHGEPGQHFPERFRASLRVNPARRLQAAPAPGAVSGDPGGFPPERQPRSSGVLFGNLRLQGWCFLELNLRFIQTQLLPLLVEQYFGAPGLANYRVAVVTGDPPRAIYASSPGIVAKQSAPFDARITLFTPHAAWNEIRTAPVEHLDRLRRRGALAANRDRRWVAPPSTLLDLQNRLSGDDPDSWRLVAQNEFGSLDAQIGAVRRRNLAIGFGTLLLLAGSIATLVIATHRAHLLAKRQMEFVAGISHELRTPLTVIESAAFNLARGGVGDQGRVQQYGEVIQTEGRRLSNLVTQTLAYAGVQAGRQPYEFKPAHILQVIDAALSEYESAFRKEAWHVEKKLDGNLPLVSVDAQALKSTIRNLIGNALKYASDGKWLGVTVRAVATWRDTEIQVSIADHGPGIDSADLPHIFEPFYRGRKIVASAVPGAGLGLSLVERHMQAHRGKVSVRTVTGCGTEFTLYLPCQ